MSDALVRVRGLSKSFETGDGTIDVLHGIDFEVRSHERLAIVGASGVGKSTLLYILGTIDHPTTGTVEFRGGPRIDPFLSAVAETRSGASTA